MLSRFVTAFLPRIKHFNFLATVTICRDFGAWEYKTVTASIVIPIYLPWSDWTLHEGKRGEWKSWFKTQHSSSLSVIGVVSSTYLRLMIFLLAIVILACDSSSPAFCIMYSAYKLNKQSNKIQLCHTPFPILNQSVVPCKVLILASWPAYRFLRR